MAGNGGGGSFCFLDNVMWFIRVILCLYLMFGIYSIVKAKTTSVFAVSVLLGMTFICTICVIFFGALFHAISIPIFTIGVLMSDFDIILKRYIYNNYVFLGLIILTLVLAITFRNESITSHIVINYLLILILIKLFTYITVSITGFPKWLSPQSFNVYLIHNKVLMIGKALLPALSLMFYIGAVIIVSVVLSIVRRVLHI